MNEQHYKHWDIEASFLLYDRGFSTLHAIIVSGAASYLLFFSDFFQDSGPNGPVVFRSSILSQMILGVRTILLLACSTQISLHNSRAIWPYCDIGLLGIFYFWLGYDIMGLPYIGRQRICKFKAILTELDLRHDLKFLT